MKRPYKEEEEQLNLARAELKRVAKFVLPHFTQGLLYLSILVFGIMAVFSIFPLPEIEEQVYTPQYVTGYVENKTYIPESSHTETFMIMYSTTMVVPVDSVETVPEKFVLTINQNYYKVGKDVYNNVATGDKVTGTYYNGGLMNVKTLNNQK